MAKRKKIKFWQVAGAISTISGILNWALREPRDLPVSYVLIAIGLLFIFKEQIAELWKKLDFKIR